MAKIEKDKRYGLIQPMLDAGRIRLFQELFDYIPKTIVAKDLGINNVRFSRLMIEVDEFSLKDLLRLADFMEIEPMVLLKLVIDQRTKTMKAKKDKVPILSIPDKV